MKLSKKETNKLITIQILSSIIFTVMFTSGGFWEGLAAVIMWASVLLLVAVAVVLDDKTFKHTFSHINNPDTVKFVWFHRLFMFIVISLTGHFPLALLTIVLYGTIHTKLEMLTDKKSNK
tara:strand:- start:2249 stop:2608 length:360 start_codon:yes stop_codon:yes gene_type:complete